MNLLWTMIERLAFARWAASTSSEAVVVVVVVVLLLDAENLESRQCRREVSGEEKEEKKKKGNRWRVDFLWRNSEAQAGAQLAMRPTFISMMLGVW